MDMDHPSRGPAAVAAAVAFLSGYASALLSQGNGPSAPGRADAQAWIGLGELWSQGPHFPAVSERNPRQSNRTYPNQVADGRDIEREVGHFCGIPGGATANGVGRRL